MHHPTCAIEGCDKPTRTKSAALCKMHYHRQYRSGSTGEAAERKRKQLNTECRIEGCPKPDKEAGLCAMHGARNRRHGDPHVTISPSERHAPAGAEHPNWAGAEVGYDGAHFRVKRFRGSASKYACIDCDQQAQHWSYNHDDPNELKADIDDRYSAPYSSEPSHYSPRCASCHKVFDLEYLQNKPSMVINSLWITSEYENTYPRTPYRGMGVGPSPGASRSHPRH